MLLTVFLAMVFCGAITLLLISAVAFIQDNRFFSSAPKEALEVLKPRNGELFYGARAMGWVLMILSALTILGIGVVSIWDGFRSSFGFGQFFLRFVLIFTIYKAYDMIFFPEVDGGERGPSQGDEAAHRDQHLPGHRRIQDAPRPWHDGGGRHGCDSEILL